MHMQAQDLPESITSMTPEPGWSHSSACAVQQSVMGRGVHGGSKSTPLFLRTACTRHAASTAAFAAWHHCSLTMTELTSSMQGACQHMRVLARQGRAWVCPRGWAGGARCSRYRHSRRRRGRCGCSHYCCQQHHCQYTGAHDGACVWSLLVVTYARECAF